MFDKLISDGWQFCGYNDNCPVFRKVVVDSNGNRRGKWCAIVNNEVQAITYEQGLGYEAITSAGRMSRKLGAMLLPH